jgi:hypothetical protein
MTLQYLAGIIDGEGHICRSKSKNGAGRSYTRARIIVTNTSKPLMEAITKKFGGFHYMRKPRPNHLDCYVWALEGKKAEALGRRLKPYLIVKSQQVLRIL